MAGKGKNSHVFKTNKCKKKGNAASKKTPKTESAVVNTSAVVGNIEPISPPSTVYRFGMADNKDAGGLFSFESTQLPVRKNSRKGKPVNVLVSAYSGPFTPEPSPTPSVGSHGVSLNTSIANSPSRSESGYDHYKEGKLETRAELVDDSPTPTPDLTEKNVGMELAAATNSPCHSMSEEKQDDMATAKEQLLLKTAACTELPPDQGTEDYSDPASTTGPSLTEVITEIDSSTSLGTDDSARDTPVQSIEFEAITPLSDDQSLVDTADDESLETPETTGSPTAERSELAELSLPQPSDPSESAETLDLIDVASTNAKTGESVQDEKVEKEAETVNIAKTAEREGKLSTTLEKKGRVPSYARSTVATSRRAESTTPRKPSTLPSTTRAQTSETVAPKNHTGRKASTRRSAARGSGMGRPGSAMAILGPSMMMDSLFGTQGITAVDIATPNASPQQVAETPKSEFPVVSKETEKSAPHAAPVKYSEQNLPSFMRSTVASSSRSIGNATSSYVGGRGGKGKRHSAPGNSMIHTFRQVSPPGAAAGSLGLGKMMSLPHVSKMVQEPIMKEVAITIARHSPPAEEKVSQFVDESGNGETGMSDQTPRIDAADHLMGNAIPPVTSKEAVEIQSRDYQQPDLLDDIPRITRGSSLWYHREPIPPIDNSFSEDEDDGPGLSDL